MPRRTPGSGGTHDAASLGLTPDDDVPEAGGDQMVGSNSRYRESPCDPPFAQEQHPVTGGGQLLDLARDEDDAAPFRRQDPHDRVDLRFCRWHEVGVWQ